MKTYKLELTKEELDQAEYGIVLMKANKDWHHNEILFNKRSNEILDKIKKSQQE